MAHLPGDAAIFSPSVARHAASNAKDWAFVDSWLANKYKTRSPPAFERNSQTLQALLALAGLNETADDNRDLLARVEADALAELNNAAPAAHDFDQDGGVTTLYDFQDDFFGALEDSLTKDGSTSLGAMATAAVHLDKAFPEPAQLGQAMLDLQTRVFDLQQAISRVEILQRYIDFEAGRLAQLLDEVSGDEYRPPVDLARHNLDLQRKVKAMTKKLPEMKDKVSSLARTVGVPNPTIEQVRREEVRYLELLEVKRGSDQQIHEFEGLPPDTELARQELDAMRTELRKITDRRDAVFENLVERETPRKRR